MGAGSHWHRALELSALLINHNQSCAITSIFSVNYCEGQVVQLRTEAQGTWAWKKHLVLQTPPDTERHKVEEGELERLRDCFIYSAYGATSSLPVNMNRR